MTTPDFLVIGAQKCGSTTLWEDLRSHPELSIADKESNGLLDCNITSVKGRRRYSSLFPGSHDQLHGEVCTTYAMQTKHPGVVDRAHTLNPQTRIIYLVRDPLSRTVSHHHHDYSLGLCGPDINTELSRHPDLIDNSKYAFQLRPWVQSFGIDNVLVLQFEHFVSDREQCLSKIYAFLGISRVLPDSFDIHNSSQDKRVAVGAWARLSQSHAYRRFVRPAIPERTRRLLTRAVLPTAPPRPDPPSQNSLDYLISVLQPEVEALAELTHSNPLWDLKSSSVYQQPGS